LCPLIAIEALPVPEDLIALLPGYDWIVFTSANGVERFFEVLSGSPAPAAVKVAAIGPETAARLASYGAHAHLIPERFVAEDLADALGEAAAPGGRILLARARGSRHLLVERLR